MEPLNFTTIAIISLVGLTGLYLTTVKTPSIKTPFLFVLLFLGLFLGSNAQSITERPPLKGRNFEMKQGEMKINADAKTVVSKTRIVYPDSVKTVDSPYYYNVIMRDIIGPFNNSSEYKINSKEDLDKCIASIKRVYASYGPKVYDPLIKYVSSY